MYITNKKLIKWIKQIQSLARKITSNYRGKLWWRER